MFSEQEAKTKWCPFVRLQVVGGVMNRIFHKIKEWADKKDRQYMQDQEDACKCIGSACSQWRWAMNPPNPVGASYDRNGLPSWGSVSNGTITATPPKTALGHCGLAGKP